MNFKNLVLMDCFTNVINLATDVNVISYLYKFIIQEFLRVYPFRGVKRSMSSQSFPSAEVIPSSSERKEGK